MNQREIERLLGAIRQARSSGEAIARATVVRVKGSAYRHEGTWMVIRQNGTCEGALSGGCLETSVTEAAINVITTGEPATIHYDLADESLWGLGMGCGGAVDVLIERIDHDAVMPAWLDILERGDNAVLMTALNGAAGRVLLRGSGGHVGQLSDAAIEREALARARVRLVSASPQSGTERIGHVEVFFEVNTPAPELVIFGAGLDADPLARQAWALGFSVTVVDVRQAYLTPDRFPQATRVPAHFSEFSTTVSLRASSFVVIMNHFIERDEESLRFALDSEAAYIGVLGPRERYHALLAGLAVKGYVPSDASLMRVHSPVGLSLGAESPVEVAMSILGEILAVRRGFSGGFLSGCAGSIHGYEITRQTPPPESRRHHRPASRPARPPGVA